MNTVQSAAKQSKKAAQQIAKQMAREPFEVLKTARRQVTNQESSPSRAPATSAQEAPSESKEAPPAVSEELDREKSRRRIEAHRRELESIQSQKTFEDLQKRISEGEEIPVENFSELSMEQKQVLRAQAEAVKKQMESSQDSGQLIEPTTKKKGVLKGMAGKLDKAKRKAEIRTGPSG